MALKCRRQGHGLGSKRNSNEHLINYPSFFVAHVSSPFVVFVVIVLISVDAVVCVSGRDGFPPSTSIAPRRNVASRYLHRYPFSLLHFFSSSSLSENKNDADDGDYESLLLLFRHYYSKPPHDRRLYEILGVQPNSTIHEIKKAWRRLSRECHPDKVRPIIAAAVVRRKGTLEINSKNNCSDLKSVDAKVDGEDQQASEEEIARQKLSEITHAYEILSDDRTRLLYHRFGLVGGSDAAIRLLNHSTLSYSFAPTTVTSAANNDKNDEEVQVRHRRLMELMGHSEATLAHASTSCSALPHQRPVNPQRHNQQQQQQLRRIDYLTATITERLRPIIEGTISQESFIEAIYRECNSLKYIPLGAQIIRCIGRAYQAEGRRALRRKRRRKIMVSSSSLRSHQHYHHHHSRFSQNNFESGTSERGTPMKTHQPDVVVDAAIDLWNTGKHYAMAAMASGRLVMMERKVKKVEEVHRRTGTDCNTVSDDEFEVVGGTHLHPRQVNEFDRELKYNQKKKLHEALLSAHQLEALWKISKIELYRAVRQACRRIVEVPNHMTVVSGYGARHHEDEAGHGSWCANFPSWGGHQQSSCVDDWRQRNVPPPSLPPTNSRVEHHPMHHHIQGNAVHWNDHDKESIYSGEVGRLRAAAAMVLVGNIMIQCSKDESATSKKTNE